MNRMTRYACVTFAVALVSALALVASWPDRVRADTPPAPAASAKSDNANAAEKAAAFKLPEPKGAKRLAPNYDVWIDPKNKSVIVDGQVSLRVGMLEMFACTRNTKEHESIVSANTKAYLVHAALLTLGAEPGSPVQFVPKYRPPRGTEIDVTVEWRDEHGKPQRARAQDWIKDIKTKKPMTHPFVFAGSSFWVDEETKKKFYQAEAGDFICVSNFGTAMLDIPVESSPENSQLEFEAFTKRIPPLGAPVRLILTPNVKGAAGKEQPTSKKAQATSVESKSSKNGTKTEGNKSQ
jgi:hypothetical protein